MSQHSIFGVEDKIGHFRLFDQILIENTTLNSKTNQKACFYVSFHHIWRYILIEDVSAQYTRHQSWVFAILEGTSPNFDLVSTNFWPCRTHIPQKKSKGILVHQLPSYTTLLSHMCTICPQKSPNHHISSWFLEKRVFHF